MKSNTKQFPKNKIAWLWENMEGKRALYFVGILGTVLYNILQLTIPYFSGKIVDLFLTGENAATNLQVHRDLLYRLLFAMVGFTFLRVIVVYGSCMIYETVSKSVLYRVRNYLYDKLQRQDMTFYSTYRTGDLMTRQTGDLDAVRHMVAWVVRMVVESFSLFAAAAVFFLLSACVYIIEWNSMACNIVFFAVALLLGIGFGIMFPAYNTLFVNLAPNSQRGTATSTYLTSWDVGIGIGMLTGGYIAEVSTFDKAYLFGACLTIVSMLYFNIKVTPHYHKNKLR